MLSTAVLWTSLASLAISAAPQQPWRLVDTNRTSSASGLVEDVLSPAIKSRIDTILEKHNVTGHSLAVVRLGAQVEYHQWGNRTEDGEAPTKETLFYLGSCSKAFLATSVGIIIDDYAHGKNATPLPDGVLEIQWNSKIKDLFPGDWLLADEWTSEKATLKDALSHVTGLPRHDLSYTEADSPIDIVRRMQHLRPEYELRAKWHYNNQMFILGQLLVSRLANTSYPSFVQSRIFEPLNMCSTTYFPSEAEATGHFTQSWSPKGRRIPSWFNDQVSSGLLAGAGGLISSTVDMAQWMTFLLGKRLTERIPHAAVDVPMQPTVLISGGLPALATYGMGWMQTDSAGHRIVFHAGRLPGAKTFVSLFPQDGLGIVQFANTLHKDVPMAQITALIANAALETNLDQHFVHDMTSSTVMELGPLVQSRRDSISASEGPQVSLEALAGTYIDRGYGSLTLCAPGSVTGSCPRVLAAFAAVDSASVLATASGNHSDALYASWTTIWNDHVRLTRANGNDFHFVPTSLFPEGYGRNKTPFEMPDVDTTVDRRMEFDVDATGRVRGLGVFGLAGEVTERQRLGRTIRERAEIWFERVI